ncbi:MAG: phosphatase PAP2 family protein [Oryzomonas sp.]|uniref:phosphatase PAP2 family protein n=1 Tax=Oryzomonas sp. TaxID=2855186 RepID=UPI00284D7F80|nr:phosphatase PAP2 family protein [Oryzomonas sp.]MDR3578487.1 phosphatase PAP2 family protein [Oryzomonas sp.]
MIAKLLNSVKTIYDLVADTNATMPICFTIRGFPLREAILGIMTVLLLIPALGCASEIGDISIGSEIGDGISRLGHETVELARTPFQIDNGNILVTIGVGGAVGLTYVFDKDIHDKLQASKGKSLDKATNAGSQAGNPVYHLGFAALVYGGAIAADSPKWKEVGEMLGESLILTDASTFLLKEATGRGRPYATQARGDFMPLKLENNYDSFPSMHTASSFALASVMASTSESFALKAAYYSAATFVGFSRLYQNQHWASDVVMGAALGELCGRIVTHYHATGQRVAIVPQILEKGAGLAMVGKW